MLAQASLPLHYWIHAFTSTVFLINRLPTKVLGDNSPYEKLFQKQPDYSILKVFGCQCYPYIRPYNLHKISFRSTPCVFLGYSTQHKGYKCLDLSSGKLYISRHVTFDEGAFTNKCQYSVRLKS